MAHTVARKEQDARDDQCAADKVHIITQLREKTAKRHHNEKRQRAHNDEQDETARRRHGVRRAMMGKVADAGKKLHDHIADIVPVSGKHRHERAEVEQHIEKVGHVARVLHVQQVLRDGEMSGGRNR